MCFRVFRPITSFFTGTQPFQTTESIKTRLDALIKEQDYSSSEVQ